MSLPSARPPEGLSGRILRSMNRIYCRGYHQIHLDVACPLPAKGNAILVCNHISGLDPLLLQSVIRRPVIWMMASEYYNIGLLRWFFRAVQAIPVHRSGRDMAATRAALRALDHGHVLGIFPEGRIQETSRDLLPFQTGVAMIAQRARAPIYPASLEGTNRGMKMLRAFSTPNEVRLRFGAPLWMAKDRAGLDLNQETQKIQSAVSSLMNEKT